jgi:soluble lytic murein transglycosylase-like protein
MADVLLPDVLEPAPDVLRLSASWPAGVRQWAPIIERWAAQYAIDPDLIGAVVFVESAGNPNAVSRSGACGLMQVMARDTTAQYGRMFADRPTCAELKDPERNISWAVHYLAVLYERNGHDWRQALYRYGPVDRGYTYADLVLARWQAAKD